MAGEAKAVGKERGQKSSLSHKASSIHSILWAVRSSLEPPVARAGVELPL